MWRRSLTSRSGSPAWSGTGESACRERGRRIEPARPAAAPPAPGRTAAAVAAPRARQRASRRRVRRSGISAGARSPRGRPSFARPEDSGWIEVGGVAAKPSFELRFQLIAAPHLEIRVVDDDPPVGRVCNRALHRFESLREQLIVLIQPSPALAVIAVRDVELRARILLRGVGALEGGSRCCEVVAPKHP